MSAACTCQHHCQHPFCCYCGSPKLTFNVSIAPSALDQVKQALKSLFKRNKKPKTQQKPKQITAAQQTSARKEPLGHLPPTHPLATGTHKDHKEAVPQQHTKPDGNVEPKQPAGAPRAVHAVAEGPLGAHPAGVNPMRRTGSEEPGVSPSEPVSAVSSNRRLDEPVSAVTAQSDEPPEPPPKGDGLAEEIEAASPGMLIRDEQSDGLMLGAEDAKPATHTTLAAQKLDPATEPVLQTDGTAEDAVSDAVPNGTHHKDGVEEPVKHEEPTPATEPVQSVEPTNSSLQTQSTAPTQVTAPNTTTAPSTVPAAPKAIDLDSEKMLAHEAEEPPPIKKINAAPGMSATSGPLEDFPEHLSKTSGSFECSAPADLHSMTAD